MKKCFIDITITYKKNPTKKENILYKNKIIVELFYNIVPKTVENFYSLCNGDNDKKLCYENNKIFRIVQDSFIQTGDVINNDGTGGESIYGKLFDDEFFYDEDNDLDLEKNHLHDEPFLLSMANNGPNTNNSQFIITTNPLPHLDGINVVFGRVVKVISTILIINGMPTYINGKLYNNIEISICNCGFIEDNYNNNEEINLEYEKSLCNQTLINISNKLKNNCKELKNNEIYNLVIQKCETISKILYNDYNFINDRFINKKDYYKIKINTMLLKIICRYKIADYKKLILYSNLLLEIP